MVVVGRTKIPYNDLFALNRRELKALIKGHEMDQKDLVEAMRKHAIIGLMPHVKKGAYINPKEIWQLPWDEVIQPFQSTKDDYEQAKRLLDIADKIKHGKSKN